MSVRYYLRIRHDVVAKTVLKALILKNDATKKFKHQGDPEYTYKVKDCEFWWNLSVKTATKLKCNKPNIVAWDRLGKICKMVEISCPADVNIMKKVEEKLKNYDPLICNFQNVPSLQISNDINCYWSIGLCPEIIRNVYPSTWL